MIDCRCQVNTASRDGAAHYYRLLFHRVKACLLSKIPYYHKDSFHQCTGSNFWGAIHCALLQSHVSNVVVD